MYARASRYVHMASSLIYYIAGLTLPDLSVCKRADR